MEQSSENVKIVTYLRLFSADRRKQISLLPSDFEYIRSVTFILPCRVIRVRGSDQVAFYFVDRDEVIRRLKSRGNLHTKAEASRELKEAQNEFDS